MTDSDVKHQADSPSPISNPFQKGDLTQSSNLYDFLKNEMAHRRGRRQQVFSWVSSLLVGITGGTIALTYTKGIALSPCQKLVLIAAILILSSFSCYWIHHHWECEIAARWKLKPYFDQIAKFEDDKPYHEDWTTIWAIVLLTLAAIAAVLLDPRH